jgi:hypothetical protein
MLPAVISAWEVTRERQIQLRHLRQIRFMWNSAILLKSQAHHQDATSADSLLLSLPLRKALRCSQISFTYGQGPEAQIFSAVLPGS